MFQTALFSRLPDVLRKLVVYLMPMGFLSEETFLYKKVRNEV